MPSLSTDQELELRLLGGFNVCLKGCSVVGVSYNRMRALLAYLAVERKQDHNREVLAELLWSGNDPVTARGNLRRTLSDLRRALELPSGKALFSASKHTIRFIPNVYVDMLEFTAATPSCIATPTPAHCDPCISQMERMAGLYRGEFMEGFSLPDCPDFEDWLQLQREALRRRALTLLERLSNCHEQAGRYRRALPFALRYTELDPWDEDGHRRAIRLYALNGQSSAALGQYDFCCRMLEKEMGVLPNKETQGLVDSIRKGAWRAEPLGATGEHPAIDLPPLTAERRQVTVLYCELTLSAIDDLDEALELLRTPEAHCAEIIRRFSGYIVHVYGGGLLAYFGYPQAHEDAALHAVQAAMSITHKAVHGIEIRVGVHTGLIITGGESRMPDAVGKTSRLAVQLRQSVGYGEVAISHETHGIVAGYFSCISLGVQPLPGVAQPVEIFKVVRESGAHTRLDAAAQLTPLVGRKAEIAKLMELWKKAEQDTRQMVLIQGEAGIGKSRLLLTLKEYLRNQPHVIRELRCFPEFSQSPFYPLIAMLESIFGFAHDDMPDAKFCKLAAHLEAHYPASAQHAVLLLAQMISLPLGGHYQASRISPQKQKEQTLVVLLGLLQSLAAQQAVLLIVEDLHWIDPSTLELLTRFVEQTKRGGVLAIFTARPEFDPPWNEALESTLTIVPLVEDEVKQMIASISGDIPATTLRRIVECTDGVPLFVEEMAKIAFLDNQANIPATLHDLLAARVDNMGEAKYTAQLAATLGREFDLNLLRKVSLYSPEALADTLNALQDAGLILKVSDTISQFKHALIQEAAYQSQTRSARQAAHRRIAQILKSDFQDTVAVRPELLAQHLSSGGETRQSIEYWIKAGQRAALNSANLEAIGHFNSGLQLLITLPLNKERDRLEFELLVSLGTAFIAAKGYGSTETGQVYTRAMELGEQLGDSSGLFKSLWGMWLSSSSRIGHLHSLELAEKLLRLAEQDNDPLQLQQAHHAMGGSLFWTGHPEKGRIHLERSMALYQPSHHEAMASQYGRNTCVLNSSLLSWVLWLQGFPKQAGEANQRTLALARQVNHPFSLAYALSHSSILNRWMRQLETTAQMAQEAMALSHEHGFPMGLRTGAAAYGWVLAMQGQTAGIAQILQSMDAISTIMSGARILFLTTLIEARVHLGQFDDALVEVNEALNVVNEKDDRFFESEFHRIKGACLIGISATNTEEAEACFAQALAISRKQHAKSLELRAAMSMARLWQQQGKQEDARRMLEEIYNGFTEGFDTHDLQEAAILIRHE